jgi:hypothetical protein
MTATVPRSPGTSAPSARSNATVTGKLARAAPSSILTAPAIAPPGTGSANACTPSAPPLDSVPGTACISRLSSLVVPLIHSG